MLAVFILCPLDSFALKLEPSEPSEIEKYISCSAREVYALANEQAVKEYPELSELLAKTPFMFSARNGTPTSVFVKAQFEHRCTGGVDGLGGSYFEHSIEFFLR